MTKYAVSSINWFDHILATEFVEADSVKDAFEKSVIAKRCFVEFESDTLEDMKCEAFNMDGMIEIVEVK